MQRRGPLAAPGRRSWGYTWWELRTEYILTSTKHGCQIARPRVHAEIVTTLPQWTREEGASVQLRLQWRQMLRSLLRHEKVHQSHAILAANASTDRLGKIEPQASCQVADRLAQRVLHDTFSMYKSLSQSYDETTGFGASEGVRLNVSRELPRKQLPSTIMQR